MSSILHSRCRAFGVVRQQTAQGLAGTIGQSPDYLVGRAVKKSVVPPGDPSLRQASTRNRHGIEAGRSAGILSTPRTGPDLTTIVVAGDVTPE